MLTLKIQLLNLILQLKQLRTASRTSDNKNYQFDQRPHFYYLEFAAENNWSFNCFSVPSSFLIVLWLRDFPPNILLFKARGRGGEEGSCGINR